MSKSRVEQDRRQKKQARQAKRRRRKRFVQISATTAIVAVAVFVGLLLSGMFREKPGVYVPSLGNRHLSSIDEPHIAYNSVPPTSGPHMPSIAPWGVHSEPIPDELQVHNLEDGGVMVQYQGIDEETLSSLAEVVRKHGGSVILAPYPDMQSPIALTAWTRIETLDAFDRSAVERFIKAYEGIDHHAN